MNSHSDDLPASMFIGNANEPHLCVECFDYIRVGDRHWIKKYETEVGVIYSHAHINCSSTDRHITAQEVVR